MRAILLALCAILLAACDPFSRPEPMLDEYVKRLGRVLDREAVLTPVPAAPALPRMRERVREIPVISVSMLDFLGLYGCELQHVVGERNSSLGRVMHASNRLDYELRFLRASDECLTGIRREALGERIGEVTERKRDALGSVVWNAVWGTREVEALLTRSKGPLPVSVDRNAVSELAADLRTMNQTFAVLLDGDVQVHVPALDPVYQRWLSQAFVGQTIRSAVLLSTRLDDASTLIESRLGGEPLCPRRLRTRSADNMHGLFVAVYASHVQPYLAQVQRARHDLIPSLTQLARLDDGPHGAVFSRYAEAALFEHGEHSEWRAFDASVARHTRAWQALLEQCGLAPGSLDEG